MSRYIIYSLTDTSLRWGKRCSCTVCGGGLCLPGPPQTWDFKTATNVRELLPDISRLPTPALQSGVSPSIARNHYTNFSCLFTAKQRQEAPAGVQNHRKAQASSTDGLGSLLPSPPCPRAQTSRVSHRIQPCPEQKAGA